MNDLQRSVRLIKHSYAHCKAEIEQLSEKESRLAKELHEVTAAINELKEFKNSIKEQATKHREYEPKKPER